MSTLNVRQAAYLLGISESLVLRFLRAGRIRGQKRGRDWEIERADLEVFAALPRARGRRLSTAARGR